MANHQRYLGTTDVQLVNRGGKLKSISIAVTGDRIWTLHSGTSSSAPQIYKLSAGVAIPHNDLNLQFTKLWLELVSGTTGEINVLIE